MMELSGEKIVSQKLRKLILVLSNLFLNIIVASSKVNISF